MPRAQRVLAVANEKGGVGKTTTAVCLADALAAAKKNVLLIDLDPTAAASSWLGVRQDGRGLRAVLEGESALEDAIVRTGIPNLGLVPSGKLLKSPGSLEKGKKHLYLSKALQVAQPLGPRWDWVVIDCPPGLTFYTVAALAAATDLLVTTETTSLAYEGLKNFEEDLELIRPLNPGLGPGRILAVRVDRRTRLDVDMLEVFREEYGDQMCQVEIRINTRLREAHSHGMPIRKYDESSTGWHDYRMLATELEASRPAKAGELIEFKRSAASGEEG